MALISNYLRQAASRDRAPAGYDSRAVIFRRHRRRHRWSISITAS